MTRDENEYSQKIRCYGIIQGTVLGLLMRGAENMGKRFKKVTRMKSVSFYTTNRIANRRIGRIEI